MDAFAGVDWASEQHAVCAVDEVGTRLCEWPCAHDEDGIRALCLKLCELGVERVAIERPDGILVERLLGAGLTVIAVHPNQAKAARERYSVARGKSDRFDAFVLAELARTDAHRLRAIRPDRDETKALRALTRAREQLVATRVALANQLRSELQAFWPGALIFAEVDSAISLAFLRRYPAPTDASALGERRMAAFLTRQGYSGRRNAAELLERMRSAPAGRAGEIEIAARRQTVLSLVGTLEPLTAEVARLTTQVRQALEGHPDAQIFAPLFRDKRTVVCPATLIAELGDCRERYPSNDALAADAGMSPVAVESGKRRVAVFRRACDKRLRCALTRLADSTRHWHPWAQDIYQRARERGQDHPHAIRTLARAWARVLWRCWQDGVAYDAERHGGLRRHLAERERSSHRPDLIADQRATGAAVTRRAARRAERGALDGKPRSATCGVAVAAGAPGG